MCGRQKDSSNNIWLLVRHEESKAQPRSIKPESVFNKVPNSFACKLKVDKDAFGALPHKLACMLK